MSIYVYTNEIYKWIKIIKKKIIIWNGHFTIVVYISYKSIQNIFPLLASLFLCIIIIHTCVAFIYIWIIIKKNARNKFLNNKFEH